MTTDRVKSNALAAASLGLSIHPDADPAIGFSYRIAEEAHAGQFRKYTNDPYIEHPVSVARRVKRVYAARTPIQVALLHDVIEDTHHTQESLAEALADPHTAALVMQITDASRPEDGNRETRKAIDRAHLYKAAPIVKLVKLADLLDNTGSIVERDPNFAKVYLREKGLLLNEALRPSLMPGAAKYGLATPFFEAYCKLYNECLKIVVENDAWPR